MRDGRGERGKGRGGRNIGDGEGAEGAEGGEGEAGSVQPIERSCSHMLRRRTEREERQIEEGEGPEIIRCIGKEWEEEG